MTFGLPYAAASGFNVALPAIRQWWALYPTPISAANATIATPIPGNLLIVGAGCDAAGDFTVTGGGATWTRISRETHLGGVDLECQLWAGIVGSSPSSSVSIPFPSVGASYVMELAAPMNGSVASLISSQGNGALGVLRGFGRNYANSDYLVEVFMCCYRSTTSPVITRSPSPVLAPAKSLELSTAVTSFTTLFGCRLYDRRTYWETISVNNVGTTQATIVALIS